MIKEQIDAIEMYLNPAQYLSKYIDRLSMKMLVSKKISMDGYIQHRLEISKHKSFRAFLKIKTRIIENPFNKMEPQQDYSEVTEIRSEEFLELLKKYENDGFDITAIGFYDNGTYVSGYEI